MGHPLAYPVIVTIGALAICLAWAPFGDSEQVAMLGAVGVCVLGYSVFRLGMAWGYVPAGVPAFEADAVVRRVRQQHRLVSRSWLEISGDGRTRWLPVYFDPALMTLTSARGEISGRAIEVEGERVYPAGRVRDSEPIGRLIDNPTRPAADAAELATRAAGSGRRLLLDAQSAIAAPFAALLWIYIAGGSALTFAAATVVAAVLATWLAAIRGSDPS
ncbi:hypothetical protein ABZ319_33450 [Nocardia sp. NPDC005978]|uniref:hypothetical protein n=1 Tax=Nocardia sp. NPDC005978 TaxID=3156725 RepID=UPI00339F91B7